MKRFFSREFLKIFFLAALFGGAAVWIAFRYVKPAPPDNFVISAATQGSPYYVLAAKIKDEAAKLGVTIEIRESSASVENLNRINNPDSDVQAAFVQGGLTNSVDSPNLMSMGRVITEPVWIFYRGAQPIEQLTDLKGKRIMIGPDHSGTSTLALKLLHANGITEENSVIINTKLPDYPKAFEDGTADAGFLVVGVEPKLIQRLLKQPNVSLMHMAQADAFIQRFPYLSVAKLRKGVVDFSQNIPPKDTDLVATRAALLIRKDLHPALITVLARALQNVQSKPSLDESDNEHKGEAKLFALGVDALQDDPEFQVPDEAKRIYKSGPSFFQRLLPFGIATLLDRAFILIIPLLGIVIPLFRLVPLFYNWQMRQRILYWYKQLKNLEKGQIDTSDYEAISKKRQEIERIEEGVRKISVPIQFAADLYNLRDHVEFVKRNMPGQVSHHDPRSPTAQV